MSDSDLGPILDKLQLLLENLPNQLPLKPITGPDASQYTSLIGFKPDDELVDLTGSKAGALNVHLERVFGYAARSTGDGILPILERGPGICAMHDILSDYCNEFQDDNVLKKWAVDIAEGAEKVYNTYQVPVRFILVLITIVEAYCIAENLQIPHVLTNTTSSSNKRPRSESSTAEIPKGKSVKQHLTASASTIVMWFPVPSPFMSSLCNVLFMAEKHKGPQRG